MTIDLRPQKGPQTMFLSNLADIIFYGGAAGGGKSYGLLLDPLRHYQNKDFGAVIFRRTSVQIRTEGGLWDESMKIYPPVGGRPKASLEWRFPSGMAVSFGNLEYEKDVFNYQGAQIALLGFDELTHFSENQFFYMLSRNRSTSGVKPRVKATTNPDPDSWVRRFIDWWIGPDGYAIKERSGVIRYFIRVNDEIVWSSSKEEIYKVYGNGPEIIPKSFTFISAKLEDNPILMEKDPGYLGNLLALNRVDRERLKEGNWNIRANSGTLFRREWFPMVDVVPAGWHQSIRFWDRASSLPHEGNKDPDWTRGLKVFKYPDGRFCIADLKSLRDTPGMVEKFIKTTASHDGYGVSIMSQEDPGSAGASEASHFTRMLGGYDVKTERFYKDKVTRAKPASAQAEAGNISVFRAQWNDEFFRELESFPEGVHDDCVDVLSGAINALCQDVSSFDSV
jgi:predicted phage terminase large subunit-like protein